MIIGPDLNREWEEIRSSSEFADGKRVVKVLSQAGPIRLTLIGMRQGAKWEKHEAKGPVIVQIIHGRLLFHSGDQSNEAPAGNILFIDAATPHDVEALEDSCFLLTLNLAP